MGTFTLGKVFLEVETEGPNGEMKTFLKKVAQCRKTKRWEPLHLEVFLEVETQRDRMVK